MRQSEKYGLKSAFYFLVGGTHALDGTYTLADPRIERLLKDIQRRGHEIGLHPSYDSCCDGPCIATEFKILKEAAANLGWDRQTWGGRQHYLRWQNPQTWQHWNDAGLDYDSTLGFADHVGFRCGTCFEYNTFNLQTKKQLQLRERPLVVMDAAALNVMKLDWEDTLETIRLLHKTCQQFAGDFTLLWHNNSVSTPLQKDRYQELIQSIVQS